MASVIDSIRSVHSDRFSLIKLGAFSYLMYIVYKLMIPKDGVNFYNILIAIVMLLFYLGFSSIIMSNRINQRIETLPSLDLNLFLEVAFKATGIALPFLICSVLIVNFVVGLFSFEGIPQLIAIWLIRLLVFSAFATALINFSENYDLKKALYLPKILEGTADVLVYTLVGILIIILTFGIVAASVLYLIYTFFKIGLFFEYISALFFTIIIAILSDYWGQLHYDISSRDKYY